MRAVAVSIDDPQWGAFAASHPEGSVFHLPAWTSIIAGCYGFDAFALTVRDGGGEILAGVPVIEVRSPLGRLRWVSLPFSDSCSLLIRGGADPTEVVEVIRDHVLSGRVRELEVRGGLPSATDLHTTQVGYHHHLRLPCDPADLHPNKGHRYNRNIARRAGIRVTWGATYDDVMTYYRLHTLTRRRLGVPAQPRRFFELIADRLIAQGQGFVATAWLDGEPLASGVYLVHNGTLTAKFGASDPARRQSGAGSLCDWEVMVEASREGLRELDFGRTDSDALGLRAYKRGWGADEVPLVYTQISRQARGVTRPHVGRLPRMIIRESPIWVCRAIGEVLYRWTA